MVMTEREEDEKQIHTTLKSLDRNFSVLMVAVRSSLDHKLQHQQLVLVDFIRWIEHRMKWVGELKDIDDLDEVFKKLHPYFDFIDCELIVDMSEQFLNDECFGEDKKNLVSKLKEHMLKAETLRCSSTVKELKTKLRQIYSPQLVNLSNMPTIQIMLHNPWNDATIGGLYLLIGHLLPHKSKQSILKYIEIDTGSVIIKYIVLKSKADSLIAHAQGRLQFMRLIGIFGLTINGELILKDDENMNFTFESALLEAAKAGHNEAVEFLLQLGGDVENKISSLVVTSLTTACQYGHSQLIITLLMHLLDYFTQEEIQLFISCAEGDHISTASHIFDSTVDINCTLVNDITPLMIASSCGHTETVQVLLQGGANVNSTDNDGYSPLVYAITGHKSLQVIEQLLKAGAQPNVFINDQNIVDKVREEGREDICKLLEQFNVLNITQKEKEEKQQLQLSSRLTIPIIGAAKIGNTEVVKFLLKENADVNIQNEHRVTALMVASQHGHTKIVKLLLKENADVNIQNEHRVTALMVASQHGHTKIVKLLLKENADVNIQNEHRVTALMVASLNGHTQVVELLLKENADVNIQNERRVTALMAASLNGHTQVVELLLKENADVNIQNVEGLTALMAANLNGHTQVVELLLKENADVNIQNVEGLTALMVASLNGHTQVVELLLKENADVNIQNVEGLTALMAASHNGHTQVVELLLKENADVNIQNVEGLTALMVASLNGHTQVVELLLKENADVNIQNVEGLTVLMLASLIGHTQIVELLLKENASVNIQKEDGWTALMLASLNGHTEVIKLLLIEHADINIQSKKGETALIVAIENKHSEVVEYLLQSKANPHIVMCIKGIEITALLLAALTGNRDIVKVLLDKSELTTDEIEKTVVLLCYGGHPTLITFLSNKLPHLTNDQRELLDSCVKGDLATVIMKTIDNPDTPLVRDVTPLMVASSCGHVDIVDALIQTGADVNKQENHYRLTPLFLAVTGGQPTSIVEMLLENGANPNIIAAMNETPLDVANDNKDEAIIELLIKYGGQIASHLEDTKQSSEQTIKSSSQTSSETMTTPTSSPITSELRNKTNKKQTKKKRMPSFKSLFNLLTPYISNPTST